MTAADAREFTRGVLQLVGLGLYLAGLAVGAWMMGAQKKEEEVGVSQSDLVKLLAAARRAEEAERERARLQKLFDDAGEGAYNVLALIDHYQDEAIENARAAAFLREHAETIAYALCLATADMPLGPATDSRPPPNLNTEERRAEAFAAVKALGELKGVESPTAETAVCPGCSKCVGSGRVPNDEAGR